MPQRCSSGADLYPCSLHTLSRRHLASDANRRIRHHPPANVGSCSTGLATPELRRMFVEPPGPSRRERSTYALSCRLRWCAPTPSLDLAARKLLAQNDRAIPVEIDEMERVLADVDADCCNGFKATGVVWHGMLLILKPRASYAGGWGRSTAGPSH